MLLHCPAVQRGCLQWRKHWVSPVCPCFQGQRFCCWTNSALWAFAETPGPQFSLCSWMTDLQDTFRITVIITSSSYFNVVYMFANISTIIIRNINMNILLSCVRFSRWPRPSIFSMRFWFKSSVVKDVKSHKLLIIMMSVGGKNNLSHIWTQNIHWFKKRRCSYFCIPDVV